MPKAADRDLKLVQVLNCSYTYLSLVLIGHYLCIFSLVLYDHRLYRDYNVGFCRPPESKYIINHHIDQSSS